MNPDFDWTAHISTFDYPDADAELRDNDEALVVDGEVWLPDGQRFACDKEDE